MRPSHGLNCGQHAGGPNRELLPLPASPSGQPAYENQPGAPATVGLMTAHHPAPRLLPHEFAIAEIVMQPGHGGACDLTVFIHPQTADEVVGTGT